MTADGPLHILHVVPGVFRQLVPAADLGDVALPAVHVLDDGLGVLKADGEGEFVGLLAVQLIVGADGDLVHIAENIQLGEGDIGGALDLHAVTGGYQVDGTHPAGPSGLGAVFRAGIPELLAFFPEHLTHKGALAHAGGIGLHHAHNLIQLGGGQTGADRRIGRHRVGGGGVGVDAVVQVPEGAQLGLKEDGFARFLGVPQERGGVCDVRLNCFTVLVHPGQQLVQRVALGAVDLLEGQILPFQQIRQMLLQMLGVEQLSGHHRLFLVLVGIEGGDALLGGAVLLVSQPGFLQTVQLPVPGQQEGGPVADLQILRGDGHPGGPEGVHLRQQVFAVQRHAVAQNVYHTFPENAGGQQVEGEGAPVIHHGMSGVAAALIPHHHVKVVGEIIHHAALAFVAPVDPYDCAVCHLNCLPNYVRKLRTAYDCFF